jgi:hypothetical protein
MKVQNIYIKPLLNNIWVRKKGPKGDHFFGLLRLSKKVTMSFQNYPNW